MVDQHLTWGGPQEMDSFENIISPLVLIIDNFYLCRKEGKIIPFSIKIQIISCFKDIALIQTQFLAYLKICSTLSAQ